MNVSYSSEKARTINSFIFETIYHASIEASNEIAIERMEGMKALKLELRKETIYFTSKSPHETTIKISSHHLHNETQREGLSNMIERYNPTYSELKCIKNPNYIGCYSSFENSPASKGELQFDLWKVKPSDRYDWDKLKDSIKEYGLRNSLCVAPMPTASTSQILGNNE